MPLLTQSKLLHPALCPGVGGGGVGWADLYGPQQLAPLPSGFQVGWAQDWLHNLQGPVQNENAGPLIQMLRISKQDRGFPGGPVVKNPRFHCRGHGFYPWSGN